MEENKCEMYKKQLEEIQNKLTDEMFKEMSVEEKKSYLNLLTQIKTKIEILEKLV